MMRNFFTLIVLLLFAATKTFAQSYNNDWIDYSKTYYKFKIGTFGVDFEGSPVKKGVVRINRAALSTVGLAHTPVEQLQLWRNGKEIPFYTSKTSGLLAAADYIEFWGEAEDGVADKGLYPDPNYQLSDYWSLETDSAAYFFTVNTASPNKRLVTTSNSLSSVTIQPDYNFIYTLGKYYRDQINPGFGSSSGSITLYSSSYDNGEGLSSTLSGGAMSWAYSGLFADTSGPSMTASFNIAGAAFNPRSVAISLNNTSITQFSSGYFSKTNKVVTGIDPHLVANGDAYFFFQDLSPEPSDNFVVGQLELDYPRKFNFGGQSQFEFYLNASDTGRYLKIANFDANGSTPVLYDLANNQKYTANTSITDTLRFLLHPSSLQYHLVLVRGDGSTATKITAIEKRQFTDFSQSANQGNYLIITNPVLYDTGANNYIQQYSDYRSSVAGGGFKSVIVDINDLEDQFAFGIKRHPLAIKNFLKYARNKFSAAPADVFLIGKGLEYNAYRLNETDPLVAQTGLVATFGAPGSDNLMSSNNYDPVPATPIGRLSAVSSKEVGDYLAKIKQYEAAQQSTNQTAAYKGWMKNVLQLTGVNDPALGEQLDHDMSVYKGIISDTFFGANVILFSKSADPANYPKAVSSFTNIFNQGSSLVTYFGHSSSTDLDFSLDNPGKYDNTGRYPVFIVNGCLAGNIFDYDPARLTNLSTISEKFILQPQKGAIGYLSTTSFGVVSYLNIFTKEFYKSISLRQYGKGFGKIMQDAISSSLNITGYSDFYGRLHAEQYAFHGDPALTVNSFAKPDYSIQASGVTLSPAFISVADDSFSVKVVVTNLGKAISSPVHFTLFRKLSASDSVAVFTNVFASIKEADSVTAKIAIIPNRDNGIVTLVAHIDDDNKIAELSETNNVVEVPVTVSSADIRPVYPYNYAIVTSSTVSLAASTANPLDTVKKYLIQMDTTVLFNSSLLTQYQITSPGGVIQQKNVALPLDNTVYYWRVSPAGTNHWNAFSFIHRSAGSAGYEQAHFYQFTQSSFANLQLDTSSRNFSFARSLINLFVKQAIYPYSGSEDNQFSVAVNGTFVGQSACVGNSIIFNVFDPLTFKVRPNSGNDGGSNLYNSGYNCKGTVTVNNFEFATNYPSGRNDALQFLQGFVHDGDYVVARSVDVSDYAPVWADDTTYYGHNNSLYYFLTGQGIDVDSYNSQRSYIYVFKKNDSTHFTPISIYSDGLYDATALSQNVSVLDTLGYLTSPKFGPGKKWNSVSWQGADSNGNNVSAMNVIGVDKNNHESILYTLDKTQHTQDISAVDADNYPYIKLQMRTQDSLTAVPYQLQDWAVGYLPSAEAAVAPNIGVSIPDTVKFGHAINYKPDTLRGYVVFKNVSISDFDSLKVSMVLTDSSGAAYNVPAWRTKPLVAGDTVKVAFAADVTGIKEGLYNLYLVVNADNDQPEQYLFNNALYKYVFINRSEIVPVHLLSFTGQAQGKGVELSWKVTNEINFSHYGVEYSDNSRSFVQIGSVDAKGTVTSVSIYNFFHSSPVPGKNYYRLKMVDKDGKFSYSNTVVIQFGADAVVKVYPNPFTSFLNISVSSLVNTKNTVKVLDLQGRVIMQQTFNGGNTTVDVSKLAAGTYMVQVNGSVDLQSFKMQKQSK